MGSKRTGGEGWEIAQRAKTTAPLALSAPLLKTTTPSQVKHSKVAQLYRPRLKLAGRWCKAETRGSCVGGGTQSHEVCCGQLCSSTVSDMLTASARCRLALRPVVTVMDVPASGYPAVSVPGDVERARKERERETLLPLMALCADLPRGDPVWMVAHDESLSPLC